MCVCCIYLIEWHIVKILMIRVRHLRAALIGGLCLSMFLPPSATFTIYCNHLYLPYIITLPHRAQSWEKNLVTYLVWRWCLSLSHNFATATEVLAARSTVACVGHSFRPFRIGVVFFSLLTDDMLVECGIFIGLQYFVIQFYFLVVHL